LQGFEAYYSILWHIIPGIIVLFYNYINKLA